MSDLDARLDLAKSLFGGSASQSTNTIKGTVMADSSSGTVSVKIGEVEYDDDGNIIVPESELIATIPIIGSATTGDEVTVIVEDGSPTAIAAPGWGDNIKADLQYMTFEPSGSYPGLHIHENASSYNTNGDLWLNSGAVDIRKNGTTVARFAELVLGLGVNSTLAAVLDADSTVEIDLCNEGKIDLTCQENVPFDLYDIHVSKLYEYIRIACTAGTGFEGNGVILEGDTIHLKGDTYTDYLAVQGRIETGGDIGLAGGKLKRYDFDADDWVPYLKWEQVTTSSGTTSKTIDLTGKSEVMVVADLTRYGVLHTFANSFPIQALGNSAHEYKIGGYVGTSGTSGGAWCSMSLTSFAGANACINGTSFINSTDWTVYAR